MSAAVKQPKIVMWKKHKERVKKTGIIYSLKLHSRTIALRRTKKEGKESG